MFEEIINSNDYIKYLEYLKIDTSVLKEKIQNKIEQEKGVFETYWNRIYSLSSPNINLENIVFEESNKFILHNCKNEFDFDISFKLDMESLIATKYSYVERPNFKNLSEIKTGIKSSLGKVDNFIRIAKFEAELLLGDYRTNPKQYIIFEGLTPIENTDPFFYYLPSSLIWKDAFYYAKEEKIIGLYKKFNTVEAKYILWVNSIILQYLGLRIDDFNKGLRALNSSKEVVLEFRQWRKDLIGNSNSFVGEDSNIAKLEGSELLLREDYFNLLKNSIPNLVFIAKKQEL